MDFEQVSEPKLSPDGSDLLVQNNLIVRMQAQCIDATPNGTSGSISPLRFTFRQNTVWNCGNGGLNITGPLGSRGGNVLDRNVFYGVNCSTSSIFASADHNLVRSGCSLPGTNVNGFTPTFADTTNYLPTNLPAGYADAGYRSAPAGHTAAP